MTSVVIIGAGQAGFQTAASLRLEGFSGSITLIGEERHLPYQRPPLSKALLAGKQSVDHLFFRPERFYLDHNIDLLLNERAVSIDRKNQTVSLASRQTLEYEHLVLATGARVRKLAANNILYLRDIDDSLAIEARLEKASSVAIIGGGFIGLEVASVARTMGKKVTVVEARDRLMARCVAPIVSEFFRQVHENQGVKIVFNSTEIPAADLTVAGIGVLPNVEIAQSAGLTVQSGICVDAHLKTSDAHIFAIGDCAEFRGLVLESVQNAADQAKCVAAQIGREPFPYRAVPWFWTDQFDIKLQMAGLSSEKLRTVVRGNVEERKFSVYYFDGERLAAVDSINSPGDHVKARKLLASGEKVDFNAL